MNLKTEKDVMNSKIDKTSNARDLDREWYLPPPYGTKTVLVIIVAAALLLFSGKKTEIDNLFLLLGEAAGNVVGLNDSSQVVNGTKKVFGSMFPLQISEVTEIFRIKNFDPENLPRFTRIINQEVTKTVVDPATFALSKTVTTRSVLYHPFGYLLHVSKKMIETIEIAIWAALFAILLSIPLAYYSSANYSPNRVVYTLARGIVSFFRAIPELISAMFLVLAFGFGPIAGILALAIHSAGFLGKFYAEDIENADQGPQEALRAIGVSKVKTLRYSVLPQVLPQYIAYNMYILDRNVRMATVIGIVGAGGIGQELKGRYDMFEYGHVATILVMIFITVFVLDQIAGKIRSKLI
ncbi:phosphonate ABC transporter, permease protein PhnE [Litorivicinus sp.]|nr:phosphonate ABC transporter, permease protein PhnE [Litorivicinus sp.]